MGNRNNPKNQHYIPLFLLKNFAESRNQSKNEVLQTKLFRKNEGSFVVVNIAETFTKFRLNSLGEDHSLEERFSSIESSLAPTVQKILETGVLLEEHKDAVVQLVSNLLFRTLAIRETFSTGVTKVTDQISRKLENTTPSEFAVATQDMAAKMLEEEANKHLKEHLPNANRAQRRQIKNESKRRIQKNFADETRRLRSEALDTMNQVFGEGSDRSLAASIAKEGHIGALAKINASGRMEGALVDMLTDFDWELAKFERENLILGDTGPTIYSSAKNSWGFALSFEFDDYDLVALPISPEFALVGKRLSSLSIPSAKTLNEALAKSSFKAFVAKHEFPSSQELAKKIGTAHNIFNAISLDQTEKFTKRDFER